MHTADPSAAVADVPGRYMPDRGPVSGVRVLVVAPTFNNAATLGGVIEAVLPLGVSLLVVNDGSTDATAAVLSRYADRVALCTHDANRGKAAALRTGFGYAIDAGYTHVATIDTDAQHDPADLPGLIAAAESNPGALVLGVRDTAIRGYPRANRLGRRASNTLVRWQGGGRVADSQCGLRVYPLAAVTQAGGRSGRYGFETELITRCAWAGVPNVEVPVRCVYAVVGGRVSHYRPWRDTLRISGLHARLLSEALVRWLNPRPAWRAARRDPRERRRLAVALSTGVLIGNLPVYGLQTVLSVFVAKRLRLQPVAVIVGSHVSTPPAGPLLIAVAIALGHWLLHGQLPRVAELDPARSNSLDLLRRVALDWTLGGLVLGVVLALLTYGLTHLALRCVSTLAPSPVVPNGSGLA